MAVTTSQPRLSVIVCTYDRYALLPGAIDSLRRQRLDAGSLEIIVVDNSPDQEKAARFREGVVNDGPVTYLLEPKPGLSRARNAGIACARADLVAFIDDDAVAAPDWARHIIQTFDSFAGRAGVVGGRVLPSWVSDRPSWLGDDLLGWLSIIHWGDQTRPIQPPEWLVGCNLAFDRRILQSVGGFSWSLGRIGTGQALLSNEETEVADRIHRTGRLSIYCPDAIVHHIIDPARLTRAWFRRRAAWQAVSEYIQDPDRMAAYSPVAVECLRRQLLGGSREPPGFFKATQDPRQFKRDVGLAYDVVAAMLGGGPEIDDTGHLVQPPPFASRVKARIRAAAQASPTFRRLLHYAMSLAPIRF